MTPEDVRRAAEAWLWIPDSARTVRTDEFVLVRYPDWFDHPLQLFRFAPTGPRADRAVDEALARARELDAPELWFWLDAAAPAGVEDLLLARGGVPDEILDVLALDLADLSLEPPWGGVTLRWQTDRQSVLDNHRVGVEVFGGSVPPEDRVAALAEEGAVEVAAGRGGSVVAYVADRPVGAGGVTLADGVARLWGGAVLADHRRRGVYRALLAARLAYAVEHGGTMAMVKGRVDTSGPILQRAGFAAYGRERSFRVPLG